MTLHSCGSVSDAIPDIIEAGFDCLNPVQISAAKMSPEYLKRNFGNDITFWVVESTPRKPCVRVHHSKYGMKPNAISIFLLRGGALCSLPVHNIQEDVPIENFIAMWETFQDNCKY